MDSLVGIGLYSIHEASRLTGISANKIRRWLYGYSSSRSKRKGQPGLWQPKLSEYNLEGLSFQDLLEIRFVNAFREYGVSLQTIRLAANNARELFHSEYPFTCKRFQTDGQSIFAKTLEETGDEGIFDLAKKQYVFKQVITSSLYEGIEYNNSNAERWFPVVTNKRVVLDPQRAFGKPITTQGGVATEVLYQSYRIEKDIKFVSKIYCVTPSSVKAAIEFEERIASGKILH